MSYVYTSDLARGLRVSEALESGMVGLNRGLVSDPAAPFGGVKQSGIGREGGHEGMLDYTRVEVHRRPVVNMHPGARVRKLVDFHGMSAADVAHSRIRAS